MNSIEQSLEGSTLTVRLNRPRERNALNRASVERLCEIFRGLNGRNEVRVVILASEGEKAFCAGADLREVESLKTSEERRSFFGQIAELIEEITTTPQPVIAAVQGHAFAGGCGLAAACDFVIAAEKALFGLPEIKLGLLPMIVMAPISRMIGRKALAELVLTGEPINARRGYELGFVSQVVSDDVLGAARALSTKLGSLPPHALRMGKRLVWSITDEPFYQSLSKLGEEVADLSASPESREGILAFLEKRNPEWRK